MDNSQIEQINRWAKFVRENPHKWKAEHTEFIDAQFFKSQEFLKRLSETEKGKEILLRLKRSRLDLNCLIK